MVVPTTNCADNMTNDELKRYKRKLNAEIPNVKKDFRKGW
jgi:hypothetical protein